MQDPRALYRLEMIGAIFTIVMGSALHFAFAWVGGWRPMALVAAVNESIWEHLKLAFWPGLFWAALMPLPAPLARGHVLSVKGFSLALTALVIVGVFTGYTGILGRNLLALDIATFVVAICIGQVVSAWLLSLKTGLPLLIRGAGTLLLVFQVVAYSTMTYFPPNHWLFIETRSGARGMPTLPADQDAR